MITKSTNLAWVTLIFTGDYSRLMSHSGTRDWPYSDSNYTENHDKTAMIN